MGVHTFNVSTYRKRENKWEKENNLQNSDHGESQDHFVISC